MADSKKKKFLELPRYIGDKNSFRDFVQLNMKYPKEAQEMGIEGVVHIWYTVNDQGRVLDVSVEKGIGYGCDEEAERLVRMMRFSKVKNRGLKVTSRNKARIEFKLPPKPAPEQKINYQITPKTEPKDTSKESKTPKPPVNSYTITIKINPQGGGGQS